MASKHTYTELVCLTDSYSLNKDDWIFLQEIATSTQSTMKVCSCSKPLSPLKITFHTFDSSKTYAGTHPASCLGKIYNRFKCNCCQVNMTALQFLKNYYKVAGLANEADDAEAPLSLSDDAQSKRDRVITPNSSPDGKRFNSYGSSKMVSCQQFLFVPPDVSPLSTVSSSVTSGTASNGFLSNHTTPTPVDFSTTLPIATSTTPSNINNNFTTFSTTTNHNTCSTVADSLTRSASSLDLTSLSIDNDSTHLSNTLTTQSDDCMDGSQSLAQALLTQPLMTQPLMTQSLTSQTNSILTTGSSIDSNLINSLLTTIIKLTKRIESLEGILSHNASLVTSKDQLCNPTRSFAPLTKTTTPPTKPSTPITTTTSSNTNISTKIIKTTNLPTSSVGNSSKQQVPSNANSSPSMTWAFIASQPASATIATLAKEKAFASTTSDLRRDGLKTLRSLIKPQTASRPKQVKDEATTAIYIAGFEFIKYKQIWSALREAKFQVSRIHNIQWIGKTILEFVVSSNYRAQFSSEMKVIGFKVKDFDPSVNKKASTPAECKMAKQAFVTRCVKNILYSKSPLTREFFKVAISKACSDAETKEIYDIEFSRGITTKQVSIASIVNILTNGNLDKATYAGHIKELEGLDAAHELVSKFQEKKTTGNSTSHPINVESSSMDVDSSADVEAEEGTLISEC